MYAYLLNASACTISYGGIAHKCHIAAYKVHAYNYTLIKLKGVQNFTQSLVVILSLLWLWLFKLKAQLQHSFFLNLMVKCFLKKFIKR